MIDTFIVDDDFRVAQLHAEYAEQVAGFRVVGQAHLARTAHDEIAQLRPHLVLLDLYLPDQHGFDLLASLRQSAQGSADVIVITAAKRPEDLHRAMELGAIHYLLKPFNFETFREKLLAYAAMHSQRAQLAPTISDQDAIDRVFGSLHPTPTLDRTSPKGVSPQTLAAVQAVLNDVPSGATAQHVADHIGISRATAQRYLAYLDSVGGAVLRPRYGTAGRPEHVYMALEHARSLGFPSSPSD